MDNRQRDLFPLPMPSSLTDVGLGAVQAIDSEDALLFLRALVGVLNYGYGTVATSEVESSIAWSTMPRGR